MPYKAAGRGHPGHSFRCSMGQRRQIRGRQYALRPHQPPAGEDWRAAYPNRTNGWTEHCSVGPLPGPSLGAIAAAAEDQKAIPANGGVFGRAKSVSGNLSWGESQCPAAKRRRPAGKCPAPRQGADPAGGPPQRKPADGHLPPAENAPGLPAIICGAGPGGASGAGAGPAGADAGPDLRPAAAGTALRRRLRLSF